MTRLQKLILLVLMAAALVMAGPAFAQDPEPPPSDNEVNAIAKNMYCPVCENIPLDVCGTAACAQWREEIRDKLSQGWTEEQIYDYFVLKFGDRVLAEPPRRGFNWLVYIVPPLVILGGAYVLFRSYQTWRKPAVVIESDTSPDGSKKDDYMAQMEEELKRRS